MKTTLTFACATLLALFTTSCLEHTATIRLNKDGSGTITEETLFSAEATAMMAQAGGADGNDPAAKLADAGKAAETAAKMGEGVTVEKVEKIDKDGRKGGRIVYKFADINKVKFHFGKGMSDAGGDMGPPGDAPDGGEAGAEEKPMTFKYADGVLTLANPDQKAEAGAKPEGGDAPDDEEPDAQAMAMMQQMFKDMKMSLKVEVPGGIEETNATHVDGNTITLAEIAFGKLIADPVNMKKLNAMQDASPAEVAAAFKDVEGLKMETKDEVTVKLK